MKHILLLPVFLLVSTLSVFCQSKVVAVSKSELTDIALPTGSKKDSRLLVTAAAKTLLRMKAEENAMNVEDKVEVFILPPSTGNQIVEQVKIAAEKAGWEIHPLTGETTYILLTKKERAILMCLESQKKETSLYLSPVIKVPEKVEENKTVVTQTEVIPQKKEKENAGTVMEVKAEPKTKVAPVVETKSVVKETTGDGFTFNTINFDDGWISTIAADYVQVTKGNTLVLIYYASEMTDEMRYSNLEISELFWNKLVVPNYTVKSAVRLQEPLTFFRTYFIEGDVVDTKTGKTLYIALNVLINAGICTPVMAIATDKNSYIQQFPEPKTLGNMVGYNRFAVAAKDVIGNWTASSGASVHLYNTYTGNYAGMNYAQSADSFQFNADGTYSSKHSGASSVYGNTTYYTQEYKGKVTVTNWDMSMTNRFKDATENFNAWFEVVRGGRILQLQSKTASGIQYHLVKVN